MQIIAGFYNTVFVVILDPNIFRLLFPHTVMQILCRLLGILVFFNIVLTIISFFLCSRRESPRTFRCLGGGCPGGPGASSERPPTVPGEHKGVAAEPAGPPPAAPDPRAPDPRAPSPTPSPALPGRLQLHRHQTGRNQVRYTHNVLTYCRNRNDLYKTVVKLQLIYF